jgi:3-methylcrotonyl-CoA carboxylase alpha subunit
MIAKVIAWANSREEAIEHLYRSLGEVRLLGLHHNIDFVQKVIVDESFRQGQVHTNLIAMNPTWQQVNVPNLAHVALAAEMIREVHYHHQHPLSAWRLSSENPNALVLTDMLGEAHVEELVTGIQQGEVWVLPTENTFHVWVDTTGKGQTHAELLWHDPHYYEPVRDEHQGNLTAPMPGKVIKMFVKEGLAIEKGAPLLVLEAMKMEHTLYAPYAGTIAALHCGLGEQVADDVTLVTITPANT